VVAALGGTLTDIGPWYLALAKPPWQPPGWLFGPVWTLIFACCAWSFADAWVSARTPATRATILWLFGANMVLNVAWSALFFYWRRPDWALIEVVLLWLSIAGLIVALKPVSRRAAALLAPYLAWVTIAAVLNWEVVRLNGPFGP
jgi:tryptophan-rich sensory protein